MLNKIISREIEPSSLYPETTYKKIEVYGTKEGQCAICDRISNYKYLMISGDKARPATKILHMTLHTCMRHTRKEVTKYQALADSQWREHYEHN